MADDGNFDSDDDDVDERVLIDFRAGVAAASPQFRRVLANAFVNSAAQIDAAMAAAMDGRGEDSYYAFQRTMQTLRDLAEDCAVMCEGIAD